MSKPTSDKPAMTEAEFQKLTEAARALLIKRGYLTPDGRAVEQAANLPVEN